MRHLLRCLLFQTIHDVALMVDRERAGREASPSGGAVDSQSVKVPAATERGCDAGKKINGRKRHIAVDTDGRLLMVNLTTADISDSAGAQTILEAMRKRWPWMKHLFADSAYDRKKLMEKAAFLDFTVEMVRRIDTEPGFKVVPRHWVVERTFGWMTPAGDVWFETINPDRCLRRHDTARHGKPATSTSLPLKRLSNRL